MAKAIKQTVTRGTVFPTKFISTNATHYVACPRCGAEPGFLCLTPKGNKISGLGVHAERMNALNKEMIQESKI